MNPLPGVDPQSGTFLGEPVEAVDTQQPPGWFEFRFDAGEVGRGAYERWVPQAWIYLPAVLRQ